MGQNEPDAANRSLERANAGLAAIARIESDLLEARRAEKDFLPRRKNEYVGIHADALARFAAIEAARAGEAASGTQEVSHNVGGVREAAQQTGAAASQVLSSARELSRSGETLRAQVRDFLGEVRAA